MNPIGRILRSHSDPFRAYLQLDDAWVPQFASLERFSHLIVIFHSPNEQPNQLGLAVVEILRVEDELFTVSRLDAPDGTPIFDVKPYRASEHSVPGAVKG